MVALSSNFVVFSASVAGDIDMILDIIQIAWEDYEVKSGGMREVWRFSKY